MEDVDAGQYIKGVWKGPDSPKHYTLIYQYRFATMKPYQRGVEGYGARYKHPMSETAFYKLIDDWYYID